MTLDDIAWDQLHDAYGSSEDVPGLLRQLASDDKKTREEAYYDLYGCIWHQGDRYQASSFAVPFLFELLGNPSCYEPGEVLTLITSLAVGNVPMYDVRELATLRAEYDPKWEKMGGLSTQEYISQPKEFGDYWNSRTYKEVRRHLDQVLPMLGQEIAEEVKGHILVLLAWFPDKKEVEQVLYSFAQSDSSPRLRITALLALSYFLLVSEPSEGEIEAPLEQKLPERLLISLVRKIRGDHSACTALYRDLATILEKVLDKVDRGGYFDEAFPEAFRSYSEPWYGFWFGEFDFMFLPHLMRDPVPGVDSDLAIQLLRLARMEDEPYEIGDVFGWIFGLTGSPVGQKRSADSLNELEKKVLGALLDMGELGRYHEEILQEYGFPASKDEIGKLL